MNIDTLVTVSSLGLMMWGMLKFMLRDIHKDLVELKDSMKRSETRTDHLYEMYLTLQKETKDAIIEMKDKK